MHRELLNNSLFLRYYNQWLKKPDSIVFASVADYLLIYDMVDEAIKVCREGLKHSPDAITGRLVLAKALIKAGNLDQAEDETDYVIDRVPNNTKALELKQQIESLRRGKMPSEPVEEIINEPDVAADEPAWQTVTMARIYHSQGHEQKAREIYHAILERDPSNEAARDGLDSLGEALSPCPS
jgi:tetratricopeptide (TPR) repeat protein